MSQEEGSNGDVELVGLPVEEAAETVLSGDDSLDQERVRTALESVADDGVVSGERVDEAMAEASKVVSTPETRVELAAIELSEARQTADDEDLSDLDIVGARIDAYEARLADVEERIEALGPRLREVIDRRNGPGGAYEVAAGLRELRTEANELQQVADELQQDVESFGRWLTTPDARYDEFDGEVSAVEESLVGLTETVDGLSAAVGDGDEPDSDAEAPTDPDVTWADATLRTRVLELLVADLRAELADLRAWPERESVDADGPDRIGDLADRLDDLDERCGVLAERLDDLGRPAWTDRFGEQVAAFEARIERFEPPVPWGEVEAALERRRTALEE